MPKYRRTDPRAGVRHPDDLPRRFLFDEWADPDAVAVQVLLVVQQLTADGSLSYRVMRDQQAVPSEAVGGILQSVARSYPGNRDDDLDGDDEDAA